MVLAEHRMKITVLTILATLIHPLMGAGAFAALVAFLAWNGDCNLRGPDQ